MYYSSITSLFGRNTFPIGVAVESKVAVGVAVAYLIKCHAFTYTILVAVFTTKCSNAWLLFIFAIIAREINSWETAI